MTSFQMPFLPPEALADADSIAVAAERAIALAKGGDTRAAPMNHVINVREVRLAAGAEFIVMICGDIMTMPGLPKVPSAVNIDVTDDGKITGLF